MIDTGVDALVVVDEGTGVLEGLASRSDLGPACGRVTRSMTFGEVPSDPVETIMPDTAVSGAILIMLDRGVDLLVLVHTPPAPQQPVGMLSVSDVVRDVAGSN